jgi:ribonuclease HI
VTTFKQVTIFCDGSSLGKRAVGEFLGRATNQQAEIAAAAVGLESLRQPCQVNLFTDSRYVVETMNGRFRRKTNLPWWERLDRAAGPHKVPARSIAAAGHVDETILRDAVDKVGAVDDTAID